MTAKSLSQKEAIAQALRTLNSIDLNNQDSDYVGRPPCHIYDGSSLSGYFLCGHWHGWLLGRRRFYPNTSDGWNDYITKIRQYVKPVDAERIRKELKEKAKTSLGRFFYFPQPEKNQTRRTKSN